MKLGGLFSGIGGFELAWQRNGGTIAWMCEIEPAARRVLEHRFPDVPIYHDVTQLDPDEVEPVDVVSGGSPCQGFSVAGARAGLGHGESRLFADYIRIIDRLAERGLQWAVWENVPGVLSITNDDGEMTFEHVVAALVGATEPVRLDRGTRWNSGLADRGGRAVAWRVVDSRHFGVAQRRRRVYACVAFGGAAADRAGRALLAKSEGVRGDSAAGGEAREEVAGTLGGGSGSCGWRSDTDRMTFVPAQASSLTGNSDDRGDGTDNLVPAAAHTLRAEGHDASEDGTGRQTLLPQPIPIQNAASRSESEAKTPSADAEGRVRLRDPGLGVGEPGDPQFTLDATQPHSVAVPQAIGFYPTGGTHGVSDIEECSPALKVGSSLGIPSSPAVALPHAVGFHATQDPVHLDEASLPLEPRNGEYANAAATWNLHSDATLKRGDGGPAAIPTEVSRAVDSGTGSPGGNQGPTVVCQPVAFSENQRGEAVLSNYAHAVT
jgi:DNA (cytosine-5)-methyltransferase 1